MAFGELERGKWWTEGVLRGLAESKSVQITSIRWRERDGGSWRLRVVTPQGTLYETFSHAELKTLTANERVRTSVERRLVRLIRGEKLISP